jgi:hypothetical protein
VELAFSGEIPVRARIGAPEWKTALTPQDGRYVLPLKVAVRRQRTSTRATRSPSG